MDEHERLARIRLVTERYHELQGLPHMLIGCAFSLCMAGSLLAAEWTVTSSDISIALALAVAIIVPGT